MNNSSTRTVTTIATETTNSSRTSTPTMEYYNVSSNSYDSFRNSQQQQQQVQQNQHQQQFQHQHQRQSSSRTNTNNDRESYGQVNASGSFSETSTSGSRNGTGSRTGTPTPTAALTLEALQKLQQQHEEELQQQQLQQQQQDNTSKRSMYSTADHSAAATLGTKNKNNNNNRNNNNIDDTSSSIIFLFGLSTDFSDFWTELSSLVQELIQYARLKHWKKKVLTVFLICTAIFVFYDLFIGHVYIISWLEAFILWMMTHNIEAVFAFVGIFVLSTLVFIPPALLLFGAGYAFAQAIGPIAGILAAVLACFLGSCLGAIIAFLRARYMMRDLIYLFSNRYPIVRAADRALKRDGFRIMLLLRLCPLIPFNGLNYCCGITGVSLHDFAVSLLGILPFQIYTICVGATAGMLSLQNRPRYNENSMKQYIGWVVLIVSGTCFGIVGVVLIWKKVKRELATELDLTTEELNEYLHPYNHPNNANIHNNAYDLNESRRSEAFMLESSIEAQFLPPENQLGSITGGEEEEWFWIWA